MELIDEGETDHKIIVLREDDAHFDSVHSMADLERVKVRPEPFFRPPGPVPCLFSGLHPM